MAVTMTLVLATACGDDDDIDAPARAETGDTSSAVTAEQLDNRTFIATNVTGETLVEETRLTLAFEGENVAATAGCNTMTGGYAIEDGTLVVGELAQTLMACADELQQQDEWVSALLTSNPAITLNGETLTLTGSEVSVTFSGPSTQPGSVEGTAWKIVSLDTPNTSSAAPEGASMTIADGMIAVATGCNQAVGEATVGEGTLTVGPPALTRMACVPDLGEWESSLTSFLEGELTFEVSGDQLVLSNGDTSLTLEPLA
jgi:heat shock protein HslJ